MFELYVYTLSRRDYAKQIVQFLDPDNKNNYFGSRLITREDSVDPKRKNLDLVLGQEGAILILDDRSDLWPTNKSNLIEVRPYRYFSSSQPNYNNSSTTNKAKSLAERKLDENEYIMRSYLDLLKQIHTRFFDDDEVKVCDRDVRDVMKKVRVEILAGCKILLMYFPPIIKEKVAKWVQELGGSCAEKLDESVTHLVVVGLKNARKEELLWAKRNGKYVVNERWIKDCYDLWRRMPENWYTLVGFLFEEH